MARADILISMVQSASRGDMISFRKAVESLVAEERAKKHNILAERLALSLNNGVNKKTAVRPNGKNGLRYSASLRESVNGIFRTG